MDESVRLRSSAVPHPHTPGGGERAKISFLMTAPDLNSDQLQRLHIAVRGAVQGVGFRPFVYRLATELHLTGWVNNSTQGATIEVEGNPESLQHFLQRIPAEKPQPCVIRSLETSFLTPVGYYAFEVRTSSSSGAKTAVILPDLATCPACVRELFDPSDRRYRYPFINCTNCGPRYTILESLPYDRARTTMKGFAMCPPCQAEYDDPANRRFHAQPNACPDCGPHLELWDANGQARATHDSALLAAADAVRRGEIVALKGLGGFHLLVDPRNQDAVLRLRQRKLREEKPFGLMVPSLDVVRAHASVSADEERLLNSPEAPLVLLRRLPGVETIVPAVAPNNPYLGVMLPYTPLHHLLLAELGFPVVATSGNRSEEPICTDEREAVERLRDIADCFLVHDRPIARHVDDSVVHMVLGRELVLRRARGYAPFPVAVPETLPPLLAVGAHQKNTVAIAAGDQAVLSQHIGDLETAPAFEAFQRTVTDLGRLYNLEPRAVACDLHPDYLSSRYAEKLGLPLVRVQHHYAHVLSCMTENGLSAPVLGVAWDGTGLGTDGTVWGGEFLRVEENGFERVGHLRPFRLPGGDRAAREPRRAALGLLFELFGPEVFQRSDLLPVQAFSAGELILLRSMLERGVSAPLTSSIGRLFDAAAALIGLRQRARFEGQAAMELEFALEGVAPGESYPHGLNDRGIMDWSPLVVGLLEDLCGGVSLATLAARFHDTLVEGIVAQARRAGVRDVVLTGGCFQNVALLTRAVRGLEGAGFRPAWHRHIPPNDGGIALGQLMASARLARSEGRKTPQE